MDDYNATIIFKCFSNELDYVYGLYAIKRELKKLDMVRRCGLSNRKYLRDRWAYAGGNENWCNNCVNQGLELQKHMKFNYNQILTNNQIVEKNNFDRLPNEIISLIFNHLNEYEVLNFYIAIQKCDMENFKKIAYWSQVRCESCKYIKKKYFHCNMCNLRLCSDCTIKCTYCNNRIRSINYEKEELRMDNSSHYLGYRGNYAIDYMDTCLDQWSTCGESHQYVEYFRKCTITERQYDWHFSCETCEKSICRNCIGHEGLHYEFECKNCYLNKEYPLLK
jgi:hypothetical protein